MTWHSGPLAAFDIETTGVDPQSDRIVTAAVSLVADGQPERDLSWLVDPGIPIPSGAVSVHGVTTEQARAEGRDAGEAVEEITALLADRLLAGVPIVAFNARFDLTILDREASRHGIAPLLDRVGGPDALLVVDPLILDKHFDRYRRGKRTLGAVCAHYGVALDEAHAANDDALAAARLAFALGARFPELGSTDLPELHRSQIAWAGEQAASLEEYFRKNGRAERVEGAWPIIPGALSGYTG
jgi:DNA polymerase-3 subunit epsilon